MAADRGILVPLMFKAIKSGSSFNAFYRSAKSHDISQRRSTMLSDWRDVKDMVENASRLASTDATAYPSLTTVSESAFHWSEPFVYQARVESQITPKAPPTERFITVLAPEALTMGEVFDQITSKWPGYEYGKAEKLVTIEPLAAIHWIG